MSQTHAPARPTGTAVWLIIASVIGWWAAFELTLEKFDLLAHPGTKAGCDFSVLVQCGANLMSPEGSVFGFPNPMLGLTGWVAPLVVAVALLAGARFAKWFWALFWLGMLGAFALVSWFVFTSIFVLNTLCPWCMVTWAVTIPSFYVVTVHVFRSGVVEVSPAAQDRAARLMSWVPLATIVTFGIVILLAQVRLDAIPNVWQTIFG